MKNKKHKSVHQEAIAGYELNLFNLTPFPLSLDIYGCLDGNEKMFIAYVADFTNTEKSESQSSGWNGKLSGFGKALGRR